MKNVLVLLSMIFIMASAYANQFDLVPGENIRINGSTVSCEEEDQQCQYFPQDGKIHCGNCEYFPQDGKVHCASRGSCEYFPQDGKIHCGVNCKYFPQDGKVHCARIE